MALRGLVGVLVQQQHERPVVAEADARANPRTVVVEPEHAVVAVAAVLRALRSEDIARGADFAAAGQLIFFSQISRVYVEVGRENGKKRCV